MHEDTVTLIVQCVHAAGVLMLGEEGSFIHKNTSKVMALLACFLGLSFMGAVTT